MDSERDAKQTTYANASWLYILCLDILLSISFVSTYDFNVLLIRLKNAKFNKK
jgi:hypothetical protein